MKMCLFALPLNFTLRSIVPLGPPKGPPETGLTSSRVGHHLGLTVALGSLQSLISAQKWPFAFY